MLAVSWDTVRLFLHVLDATVWVGGQLTLAVLVPVLRTQGPDAPRRAARRFNLVAWPAHSNDGAGGLGRLGDHLDRAAGALGDADPAALAVVQVDLVALTCP